MKKAAFIVLSALLSLQLQAKPKCEKGYDTGRTVGMMYIRGGYYTPFLQVSGSAEKVSIHSFYLDVHAVTNQEFLEFVKKNPQWARSRVPHLLADDGYLQQWESDFKIGNDKILNSPVTNVSWFAAEAYAKWAGKRLPTMDEWEYAASAAPVNLPKDETLTSYILNWYGNPTPDVLPDVESAFKNKLGVYDMLGLIWEWVYDFNSVIAGSDSRSQGTLEKGLFCAAASQNAVNKEDYASFMRFAFRESLEADYTIRNLGFRCAMDAK